MNYNRLCIIFDANTFEHKAEYMFSNESIERDLVQAVESSVTVFDKDNVIDRYDYIYIDDHLGFDILGRINSVEDDESNKGQRIIKFNWGADIYNNPLLMLGNSLVPNITVNNGQPVNLTVTATTAVTSTDEILDTDVALRQLMRSAECVETTDKSSLPFSINLNQTAQAKVYEFNADDSNIANLVAVFSNDTFNAFRMYNEENRAQFATFYLQENGNITANSSLAQKPMVLQYESVPMAEYSSISIATTKIRSQAYDNKIEFSVALDNNIQALRLGNDMLGRKVKCNIFGKQIETKITYVKLYGNAYYDIKLGLTRTKMTDILNSDLRKK